MIIQGSNDVIIDFLQFVLRLSVLKNKINVHTSRIVKSTRMAEKIKEKSGDVNDSKRVSKMIDLFYCSEENLT